MRLYRLARRLVIVLLLAAALLGASLPALAQGGVTVVANANLNLRAAPNSDSEVLGRVPYQTQLEATAISSDRNWVAVTYNGQGGWLSLAYTGVVSGSLGALNVSDQTFTRGGGGGVTSSVTVSPTVNLRYRTEPSLDVRPAGAIPYSAVVPALGLSEDSLFVLVNYQGQNVWVYREYVQEVTGSLGSFVPGVIGAAAPAGPSPAELNAAVQGGLAGVCAGVGIPQAAEYIPGPGVHPTVLLNQAGARHSWSGNMGAWGPANPADTQLVLCVSEQRENQIEECLYNGPSIFRYVYTVDVQLHSARTGQTVGATTLVGSFPRECRQTEPWSLVRLAGTAVSFSQLQQWMRPYVAP